ncbi:MAG: uracil-DNA glycosylase [Anaerolineales bacterium]
MSADKDKKLVSLAKTMLRELDVDLAVRREEEQQQFVFGEGHPEAGVVFVGEAPGKKEAETGKPFVGAAGKLLDALLREIGLERQFVYITNIVKDRPPGNRRPRVGEIEAYKPYLLQQLEILEPEVLVPLGLVSTRVLLKEFVDHTVQVKMKNVHGQIFEGNADWGQMLILPMYHPAASFYGPLSRKDLEEDFRVLRDLLSDNHQPRAKAC